MKKCYSVLWQPFLRDCRSVLNDMMVTYKVSYSNSNDSDEFSWTWNVPASVNKTFPLCLKMLLHLKNRQVLLMHPVHLESNGIPLQSPRTSQLYQQLFPQRSKLVPRRLRLWHWMLADPTATRKLVEVLTRVRVLVQTLQDPGRCNSKSEHTNKQELPLIHFNTIFNRKKDHSIYDTLYITQPPSQHWVTSKMPTESMWNFRFSQQCSWGFRSSRIRSRVGRQVSPDVLKALCCSETSGNTHPMTQHIIPQTRVLYNTHV